MISAGLVGLSGALFALLQGLVTPELGYWVRSGEFIFIAILGGAAHTIGAFLGAAVFQIIQLIGAMFFAGVWKMLLGATLIAVILIAPSGLTGVLKFTRKLKDRGPSSNSIVDQG
jgi:branched-chain amino acid transport system permease protein